MAFPSLPSIPNPLGQLPGLPGLPINGFAPKLPAVGPAAFTEALATVGQDSALLDIKAQMEAQAAGIGALDISSLDPGALSATLAGAQDLVATGMKDLLSKADQLKPALIDLQEEMGKLMDPIGIPSLDISSALEAAKSQLPSVNIPDLGALSASLGISAEFPSINGLDAAIDTIGKATTSISSVLTDASGSISAALNQVGGGITAPNLQSLASDFASGIPEIPSLGEVGIGIPSGIDPGKLIPKIKFEEIPEFDADGIQTGIKLVAKKFGINATAPVADDTDDSFPDPFELIEPAAVVDNPIMSNLGLLAASGRVALNTFKESIDTFVQLDEGTGENIIWQGVRKPDGAVEVTVSGYASYADFENEYIKSRTAAAGKVAEYMGGLKQMAGTMSTAFQSAAEQMKKTSDSQFQAPVAPIKFKPTTVQQIQVDTLTGVAVGLEQGAAIKKVGADFTGQLLDQLGNETEAVVEKIEATVLEGSRGLTSMIKQSGSVPAGFDLTKATPLPIEPNEE